MPNKDLDLHSTKFTEQRAHADSSQSTSAGSTCSSPSSPRYVNLTDYHIYPGSELPAFEYPAPFKIRNTFIDTGIMRPVSLEEFYEERRIHSCPVDAPRGVSVDEMDMTMATQVHEAMESMRASAEAAAIAASQAAVAAMRCWMPSQWPQNVQTVARHEAPPPTLSLASLLEDPVLGSTQLPTVGSAGHGTGACKPCAFLHTRGCENGANCNFCHLCPPGEKKRRQKEKYGLIREMRSLGIHSL